MIARGPRPARRAMKVAARVLVGYVVLQSIAIAVLRLRWPPGIEAMRHVNRRVLNPAMLKLAGGRHWYAAALHHVGRSSGREYTTPLVATPAAGHVYIPLPYGTEVDWCKNVLAAGSCTVEDHGARYDVVEPEIIPAAVAAQMLPANRRMLFKLYGIDSVLRGQVAPPTPVAHR